MRTPSFFDRVATSRARVQAREYKRDSDGQFSSGGGGDDDDEGAGLEDDGQGEHGSGLAPDGSSYTEFDVDERGSPRFADSYRAKYGPIDYEAGIGGSDHFLVRPERGSLHIADDTNGSKNREVLQELTKPQARSLSDDVLEVNTGGAARTNKATGVKLEPNDRLYKGGDPGYNGVTATWNNGAKSHFDDDAAFELQEQLGIEGERAQ